MGRTKWYKAARKSLRKDLGVVVEKDIVLGWGSKMARAKPVILSTRVFAKQGDAQAFFSKMLGAYKPGDRVSLIDQNDLAELLKRHPDAVAKIGSGIDHFEVQEADYDTQCFRLVRTDGTWERFSYHVCVAPDRNWN